MKKIIGIILAVVLALAITVPAYAAVSTDQADYIPGSVVTISGDNSNGAGYVPGEIVKVDITYPDLSVISYESAPIAEDGSWSVQFTLPNDESAVGSYNYTAKGLTSGVIETGTFTDAISLQIFGTDATQHNSLGGEENLGSIGKGINLVKTIQLRAVGGGSYPVSWSMSCISDATLATITALSPATGSFTAAGNINVQITIPTTSLTAGTTYHGHLQATATNAAMGDYYFKFNVIPSAKVTVTASPIGAQGGTFSITLTLPGASATTTLSGTTPQDFYVEPSTGFSITSIESPVGGYIYNGSDPVTGTAGAADSTTTVTLTYSSNQPPVADPGGPYLVAAGASIILDGSKSSDPDNDPLTYEWTVGGGNLTNNASSVNPTYTAGNTAGIYDVCLIVNDGTVDSDEVCTTVVVYDPSAGFVVGGGWIMSPENAYMGDSPEGKATFGFVSKYLKGKTIPDGNTEFQFKAGNLNFKSTSYAWLIVNQNGGNAQFKGVGTINGGTDTYDFMIWATDGTPDAFRIQITQGSTTIYDNGAAGNALNGTDGSGSIQIQTQGNKFK